MKNTSSSKKTQKHGRDEESADEMLSEAVNIALRAFLSAIPKDFDMASQKKNAKNTREKLKV